MSVPDWLLNNITVVFKHPEDEKWTIVRWPYALCHQCSGHIRRDFEDPTICSYCLEPAPKEALGMLDLLNWRR